MTAHTSVRVIIFILCLSGYCLANRKLLIFLIDGFRYDYIDDLEVHPGFREIVENGVKVDYMTPDFPSLSFPNYYSLMTAERDCNEQNPVDTAKYIVTSAIYWQDAKVRVVSSGNVGLSLVDVPGRNSEVHHITGNYMWDQATLKEFSLGITDDSRLRMWWDGSEPLWVTMQKLQRNVYMYYWPGCEVDILGVRPAHCEEYFYYPSEKNFTDAIEDSLNALRIGVAKYLKIKPGLVATVCDSQTWKLCGNADMAAVYYETVDVMGHHYGPSSPQVKATIKGLDNTFQILNQRIKEKSLQNDLNVIIFSDHGMTDIQWMDKVIELQQYINMSDIVKMMDRGPVVSLWPKQSKVELIYRRLSAVENMKVYKRDEIPDRYYYKKGRFVSTLTLVADLGWFIIESKSMLPFWKNGTGEPQGWQSGWHGYDNELMDMRGFFLAQGPDFKKNLRAGPIRAVDVYNLMCHTVGIQALPNNGSWARVEFMLNPGRSGGRRSGGGQPTLTFSFLLGLLLLALLNGL